MSTLQDLWNEYWWVLPVALFTLCIVGCILGALRGAHCCPCGKSPGEGRSEPSPSE
jgi:hypothetical protein